MSEGTPTLSLFSGCGGLDFGATAAGARIIYHNDSDPDACATLRKYFTKSVVDERDVRGIVSYPEADLVIGGYPCQSFSMGGNRNPTQDRRTQLYLEFARCLGLVRPKYFVAENVSGLQKLRNGTFLSEQVGAFERATADGYRVSAQILDAREYGVPQVRKRMFIVGVRRDLKKTFVFPEPTHGRSSRKRALKPFNSHGDAIQHMPLWPKGEFYERPHDPEGHFAWYYMSRNRKADWDGPSYTVVANWRHVTLHPASPVMTLTWSNLADGWKQRWDFSNEYEHTKEDPSRPVLTEPRRLSWRECARIQTFPPDFEPAGKVESKFTQVGNAVPPLLAEVVLRHLISGAGLVSVAAAKEVAGKDPSRQLTMWD